MADNSTITVALYGFVEEQEAIMHAAFANADKWATPWLGTKTIEDARVIIVDLVSDDEYEAIAKLEVEFPKAEIIAFSSKRPPHAKWHLARQPSGKVSIVGFSQLVLKMSHVLKKSRKEIPGGQVKQAASLTPPKAISETELPISSAAEELELESGDFLPFFNTLDSLLDSKPNEKRKRFNES